MTYDVIIARSVLDGLVKEAASLEEKFFHCVDLIGVFPDLGGPYVSQEGDDEPPVPCRRYPIPGTTKTIYYDIDHESRKVRIFGLIDQRRNPSYRFREVRQSIDGGGLSKGE